MIFMIVDDSSTMRKIIGLAVKQISGEIIEAENGKDALAKLQSNKIDFFIVDVNMPEMNGFDFLKNLRKIADYKTTPVLILTTESEADKKELGKSLGVSGWVVKPFQKEDLVSNINKILGK